MPAPSELGAGESVAFGDGDGTVVGRGVAGLGEAGAEGLAVGIWSGEPVGGGAAEHAATTTASAVETTTM